MRKRRPRPRRPPVNASWRRPTSSSTGRAFTRWHRPASPPAAVSRHPATATSAARTLAPRYLEPPPYHERISRAPPTLSASSQRLSVSSTRMSRQFTVPRFNGCAILWPLRRPLPAGPWIRPPTDRDWLAARFPPRSLRSCVAAPTPSPRQLHLCTTAAACPRGWTDDPLAHSQPTRSGFGRGALRLHRTPPQGSTLLARPVG